MLKDFAYFKRRDLEMTIAKLQGMVATRDARIKELLALVNGK